MAEFTITTTTEHKYREGYGVAVTLIYSGEDDDHVSDIDVSVVCIAPDAVQIIGNVPCVALPDSSSFYPVDNFAEREPLPYDDSHDLRDHWFATEQEATEHAESVREQWANPLPWQSFIQT